jgi:hypothetical protein
MEKKRLTLKAIMIFGLVLLLSSCDCVFHCSGTVYDSYTKQPIDSVKCTPIPLSTRTGKMDFSDSLGIYSVSSGLMGCFFKPSTAKVEFSKQGYKTQIVKTPIDVYLEKE